MARAVHLKIKRLTVLNLYPYRKHSHRNRVIFIHIPKNAGTSILRMLGHVGVRDHANWKAFKDADRDAFENYFKFTFVRNPYTRALSTYNYICKGGSGSDEDQQLKDKVMSQCADFDEYVVNFLGYEEIWRYPLMRPQWYYVTNQNGEVMVDFLGRVEDMARSLDELSLLSGINVSKIEHVNKSQARPKIEGISDNAANKIEKLYRWDFEIFAYDTEKTSL